MSILFEIAIIILLAAILYELRDIAHHIRIIIFRAARAAPQPAPAQNPRARQRLDFWVIVDSVLHTELVLS